jgi:uncharacterized cupredoxin-like copper-binding protein
MRNGPLLVLPLMLLVGSPAAAQPAPTVLVQLSNFKFTPNRIVLDHGRSYVLRLVNVAGGGHDLTAPAFFAAARIAPADRALIQEGEVEVPAGQVREIHLTAPDSAAAYKIKCSHSFHKMFGMSGAIIVR